MVATRAVNSSSLATSSEASISTTGRRTRRPAKMAVTSSPSRAGMVLCTRAPMAMAWYRVL